MEKVKQSSCFFLQKKAIVFPNSRERISFAHGFLSEGKNHFEIGDLKFGTIRKS